MRKSDRNPTELHNYRHIRIHIHTYTHQNWKHECKYKRKHKLCGRNAIFLFDFMCVCVFFSLVCSLSFYDGIFFSPVHSFFLFHFAIFRWNFSNLWRLQLVNHSMVVRFIGKLKRIGWKRVLFFNFAKMLVRDQNTSAKQKQFSKTMEYTESET